MARRTQIFFPIFTRPPRHKVRYAYDLGREAIRANVNSDESNLFEIPVTRGAAAIRHS